MVTLEDIRAAQRRINWRRGSHSSVNVPLIDRKTVFIRSFGSFSPSLRICSPLGRSNCAGLQQDCCFVRVERRRGVISYSSGNHAQGVAYAARALGTKAVIVMPGNAPKIKREGTEALGAEIVTVGR